MFVNLIISALRHLLDLLEFGPLVDEVANLMPYRQIRFYPVVLILMNYL